MWGGDYEKVFNCLLLYVRLVFIRKVLKKIKWGGGRKVIKAPKNLIYFLQ